MHVLPRYASADAYEGGGDNTYDSLAGDDAPSTFVTGTTWQGFAIRSAPPNTPSWPPLRGTKRWRKLMSACLRVPGHGLHVTMIL